MFDKLTAMPLSKKIALAVVIFYALAIGPMGYMSYLFMQNTVLELEPNHDSLVGRTISSSLDLFHRGQVYVRPFCMLINNNNATQPIADNAEYYTLHEHLTAAIYGSKADGGSNGSLAHIIEYYMGYYSIPDYVSFLRQRLIGGRFNETTIIQLEIRGDVDMNKAVDEMVSWIEDYTASKQPSFQLLTTSISQVFEDLQEGIVGDLLKVDAVSVPISILVLVICVGSVRMLNIPGILVPTTLAFSFGLMFPISKLITISSLAPEMSAAVLLAVTVDYSLFFATRFMDEAEKMRRELGGIDVPLTDDQKYTVVYRTTTLTAHNVLVSGLTIAISLAGISLLPADFIRAIGLVFALGAIVAVVVAMTLCPAVFLVFYDYFAAPKNVTKENFLRVVDMIKNKVCCCNNKADSEAGEDKNRRFVDGDAFKSEGTGAVRDEDVSAHVLTANDNSRLIMDGGNKKKAGGGVYCGDKSASASLDVSGNGHLNRSSYTVDENKNSSDPLLAKSGDVERAATGQSAAEKEAYFVKALAEQRSSLWSKAATAAVNYPYATLFVLFAAASPFFYFASTIRTDFIISHQVPRDAEHVRILDMVQEQVGQGTAFPFSAVLIGHKEGDVWTERFFNKTYELMKRVEKACDQPLAGTLTFAYLDGIGPVTFESAQFFFNNSWFPGAMAYQFLYNKTVSENGQAGVIQFSPPFNPFGGQAYEYLNNFRDVIEAFQAENSDIFSFVGVTGASAGPWQIMTTVLVKFPMQIGITFAVIFVLIAGTFRSIFIPIRMLVTVAYTVAVAYGAGCLVFQHQWIWKIWPAMEGVDAYSWTCPIFSFSLLCALALDYDIFLLTRVVEMKQLGFEDKAAIIKAVFKTGRIISFAGVIMAVAFGALMFASVVLLNQYAFTAFVAVLVDTFVVRTFLVPALMCVVPAIVWWPRKFGECNRDVDDMDV